MNKFFYSFFRTFCLPILIFSVIISLPASVLAQQTVRVTGTVVDAVTGDVIPGASIVQTGTTIGAVADANGRFEVTVAGGSELTVTFVGYTSLNIAVPSGVQVFNMDITMQEDVRAIDALVVVGYGTQRRSEITGAVASLTEDRFNVTAAVSSPLELAKGRIPGLVVNNPNGSDPREGTDLQIRGVSSTRSSNSPLIVIDGIPMGDLNFIPPADVESISVLKDAAAAAIYGTRGSNGVIIVTTKRAGAGRGELRPTLSYSGYVTHEYVYKLPDVLTAEEYRAYGRDERNYNAHLIRDQGHSTDWMGLLSNTSNYSHVHTLSLSGGTRSTNYRGSINYREFNPLALESDQTQWGARLTVNHTGLNDKLDLQVNINSNFRNRNHVGNNDTWEQVAQRNPTGAAKDSEGNWIEDGAYNSFNPLRRYSTMVDYSDRGQWLLSGRAAYTIIDGLKASVSTSWQQHYQMRRRYYERDSRQSVDSRNGGGEAQRWGETANRQIIEFQVDYNKSMELFGMHNSFNVIAGHSYEYYVTETFNAMNSGFLTDAFTYNHLGNGTAISTTSNASMGSEKYDDKLAGFFGRLNYALEGKYLLTATLRVDGSSRFGANNRWGTFPSISGGWIASSESFMQAIPAINFLKLRLSYGVTGNIPGDRYRYLATLGTGGQYPIDGVWYQTYGPARNPNPDLRWEEKRETNIGIDFSLFDDRISGTLDYFNRNTVDMIDDFDVQLPPFVHGTVRANAATMNNKGIELGLSAVAMKSNNFSWEVDAIFMYVKNTLVRFGNQFFTGNNYREFQSLPAPGNLGNAFRTYEGRPVGEFYGKRFAGFTSRADGYEHDGRWLFYNEHNEKVQLAQIQPGDLTQIGNGTPKYHVSLTNTFRYKNFDMTVFLRGKFDFVILNARDMYFGNPDWLPNNVLRTLLTKHTELRDAPEYSDYYLERGDFVKLDNLVLGYNFNITNRNSLVRRCRIYASGQNLLTITKYSGPTPDLSDTGLTPSYDARGFFPVTSTVMFGIDVTF